MRDLRMLAFQLRQFAATGYFVQVLILATLTSVAMQWLVASGSAPLPEASALVWPRAAVV